MNLRPEPYSCGIETNSCRATGSSRQFPPPGASRAVLQRPSGRCFFALFQCVSRRSACTSACSACAQARRSRPSEGCDSPKRTMAQKRRRLQGVPQRARQVVVVDVARGLAGFAGGRIGESQRRRAAPARRRKSRPAAGWRGRAAGPRRRWSCLRERRRAGRLRAAPRSCDAPRATHRGGVHARCRACRRRSPACRSSGQCRRPTWRRSAHAAPHEWPGCRATTGGC